MPNVLSQLDMRSVTLTPTLLNGQTVATPDDWFVDVWYRDANGNEKHKGVGVCSSTITEAQALESARRSMGLKVTILNMKACRLFQSELFRKKAQDRNPTLDQMAKTWMR